MVGEKLMKLKNGNYFFYYGLTKGYRGTGFYIHKNWINKIIDVRRITERISLIKLDLNKKTKLLILQIYAPTQQASQEERDEFYEVLQNTLWEGREYYNIIIGDYTAKLGNNLKNRGLKCLGAFCSGNVTSKNGEILVNFSEDSNLKIANTFYKKKLGRKWTWQYPDGKTKNEINYRLVNDTRIVKDVSVLKTLNFPSDHRAVHLKLKISKRAKIDDARRLKKRIIEHYPRKSCFTSQTIRRRRTQIFKITCRDRDPKSIQINHKCNE